MKSTPVPPESVVVGYDGSTGSDLALDSGRRGGPSHGATAAPGPCVRPPPPAGVEPSAELDAVTTLAVEQVTAKAPELTVTAQTREGSAAAVLVEASATAGTVVVGARGHGAFASVLVGSVSEQVATHAQCPVRGRPAGKPGARVRGRAHRRRPGRLRALGGCAVLRLRPGLLPRGRADGGALVVVGGAGRLRGRCHLGGRLDSRVRPGDRHGRRAAGRLARAVPGRRAAPPPRPRPPGRHVGRGVARRGDARHRQPGPRRLQGPAAGLGQPPPAARGVVPGGRGPVSRRRRGGRTPLPGPDQVAAGPPAPWAAGRWWRTRRPNHTTLRPPVDRGSSRTGTAGPGACRRPTSYGGTTTDSPPATVRDAPSGTGNRPWSVVRSPPVERICS